MKTSIATVCLSGTLAEKMRAAADAGFDGIEIFEQDLMVSPHSPEQIRQRAAEMGLTLDLYQPFRDFNQVGPELFEANLQRMEHKFALMNRLGIDTMLVCSNVATATIDDDELAADQLRRAGELADRYDVRLAYEALAWGRYVDDFEHAQRIVDLADHPRVGTCLDSFHILSRGWDPAPIADIDADKIFFVQLADAPQLSMDVLSWSRHHRVFPGQGNFDLVGFMRHLVAAGYAWPVSLEIFNDAFRQADVHRTAVDGLRSLRWLEDQTRRALAADPPRPDSPRRDPLQLRELPAIEAPTGHDYIEIRTARLGETTRMLHQLGFALAGHHQSKEDVQLWVQGPVRLVIAEQADPGSPTAIAGLGFQLADPAAATERARLLGARPVPRTQRHDEAELRGVFAPDGTEIFFCPPADVPEWLVEFGVGDGAGGTGLPTTSLITGIDHLNLAQPWQHLDEAVLFLTSVLGLHAQPPVDVPGPAGLVRSQVMDGGAVRLPLNVAPEGAEQGSFLGASHPEHIALSCSDVVTVAERARQRGLPRLPVPQNYYDDLRARFGLSAERTRLLQDNGLLYDRDEGGEFWHFYTGPLGSRAPSGGAAGEEAPSRSLFLEVIERRGDYAGYGAADAPVRLAAQYRRLRDAARGIPT